MFAPWCNSPFFVSRVCTAVAAGYSRERCQTGDPFKVRLRRGQFPSPQPLVVEWNCPIWQRNIAKGCISVSFDRTVGSDGGALQERVAVGFGTMRSLGSELSGRVFAFLLRDTEQ